MPSETKFAPDLFDHLAQMYAQWNQLGKFVLNGLEQTLVLGSTPVNEIERFAAFCRKYLSINRISTVGQVGADFGLVLIDGTQLPIARGSALVVAGYNGGISMVGQSSWFDPLPPAYEIPITGHRK